MRTFLLILVLVAACSSPHPRFRVLAGKAIAVGQDRFDVYTDGPHAQAIRVNRRRGTRAALIVAEAIVAMETATGCSVLRDRATGDTNVVNAVLDC